MTEQDLVVFIVSVAGIWAVLEFGLRWLSSAARNASTSAADSAE